MWYFTTRHSLPFTVQLLQGHDEQLSRTILSIPGKARDSFDWAPINVTLPAERVKIIIRLNTTNGPLVFDDLSVDYCDAPRPAPPNRLFVILNHHLALINSPLCPIILTNGQSLRQAMLRS
jgi:hypothetical protein